MAATLACTLLRATGALAPDLVERVFAQGLFPAFVRLLSGASALVPFSVAEVVLAGLAGCGLWGLARRLRGRAESLPPRAWLWRAACVAALGYLAFLLAWGLNYDRPPLARLLALDDRPAGLDELAELGQALLEDAARERAGLPEDATGTLRLRDGGRAALQRAPAGFRRVAESAALLAGPEVAPKALASSALFSRLGISGIYSPFTGEAHVNLEVPAATLPFAACHELAHQRGFAREDEASFVGFLACRAHPDADFRYSAAFEAASEALAALRPLAPVRARELARAAAPGVRRDWAAVDAWLNRHAGPARTLAHAVNDAYLISQGQSDGARSYGRVVDLLLAERRTRLRPGAAPAAPQPRASSGT